MNGSQPPAQLFFLIGILHLPLREAEQKRASQTEDVQTSEIKLHMIFDFSKIMTEENY